MAETKRDGRINPTDAWQDLTTLVAGIANVPILITGESTYPTQVCIGGATAPAAGDAFNICKYDDVLGPLTAANIWVRSDNPNAQILVEAGD